MPMIVPCPGCGYKRLVSGKSEQAKKRLCLTCYKAAGLTARSKRTPDAGQQLTSTSAADRLALIPKRSWWAVNSRAEFDANFAEEAGRLRLIGANIPRSQQRNIEADF